MPSSRGSSRVGPKVYKSSGKAHDTYHVGRGAKIYPTKTGEYKIKVPKK
jgi:hypothetical protein